MTLAEFLLARIAEDERMWQTWSGPVPPIPFEAQCEAKRRIVEEHGANPYRVDPCDAHDGATMETVDCDTLRYLGLPYADHHDFDEAWRPRPPAP